MTGPNLVLFLPETIRADAVFESGPTGAITPNFDRLAGQGVSFTNANVQAAFCTASRCSMFTGLYPHTHGHRSIWHLLMSHERNLFQDLKEAGYRNVVFGKNDLIDKSFTDACFDEVGSRVRRGRSGDIVRTEYTDRLSDSMYRGCREGEIFDGDDACIASALQFLDEDHDGPWCVFLPLSFAHPHYAVEQPFFSMHDRASVAAPIPPGDLSNKRAFRKAFSEFYGTAEFSDADLREIKATYFGMISRVDHQLGMILDKLDERGLADNTVVCATSDHGDYAGDYGLVEKFLGGFDDCLLRVPLMFRGPRVGERSVDAMCEMIDLYPTLLELLGVESRHFHFGRSLRPLMDGSSTAHRQAVFAEGGMLPGEAHFSIQGLPPANWYARRAEAGKRYDGTLARAAMIRTDRHQYTHSPGDVDELYDLERDPQAIRNIADEAEYVEVIADLKDRLLRWMLETSDTLPLTDSSGARRQWR